MGGINPSVNTDNFLILVAISSLCNNNITKRAANQIPCGNLVSKESERYIPATHNFHFFPSFSITKNMPKSPNTIAGKSLRISPVNMINNEVKLRISELTMAVVALKILSEILYVKKTIKRE